MGNSQSSNLNASNSPQRAAFTGSRSGTASPVPESKSYRPSRRRSIDLPDLIGITNTMESPYSGEKLVAAGTKSAPLPIPVCEDRSIRKVTQTDYAVQHASHIDQIRKNRSGNGFVGATGQPTAPSRGRPPKGVQPSESSSRVPSRGRGSQYMHYIPSNLSTTTFQRPAPPPPSRNHSFALQPPISDPSPQETASSHEEDDSQSMEDAEDEIVVHSSIPLGFYSRVDPFGEAIAAEGTTSVDVDVRVVVQELEVVHGKDGAPDEVVVKISWHGEGQNVILALESDNTWNGRQQMELETSPQPPIPYPISPPISPPASAPTSPPLEGAPVTNAPVFSTTISLRTDKHTHHIRFLVDDVWRIADNLPTAVDSTGALANYLVVGQLPSAAEKGGENGYIGIGSRVGLLTRTVSLPPASTSTLGTPNGQAAPPVPGSLPLPNGSHIPHGIRQLGATHTHGHPAATNLGRVRHQKQGLGLGYSFWSASSSNDIETVEVEVAQRKEHTGSGNEGRRRRSPPPPMKMPLGKVHYEPRWVTEIPLELIEAAQEEEQFLEHQAQARNQMQLKSRGQQNRQQTQHVSGFIPLPNIPPAQHLPRHLEKLILNTSTQHARSSGSGNSSGHGDKDRKRERERERERAKENRYIPSPVSSNNSSVVPLPVTTASGTDVTSIRSPHRSHHHHYHSKHHGHHSSSDRDLHSPSNQSPTTAVTAAAISSSAGSVQRITPGDENAALIADDSSVLPVPSHVVLHHLSTSAIKNGVLAVSQTGRYRQKFVTTIYYKPT